MYIIIIIIIIIIVPNPGTPPKTSCMHRDSKASINLPAEGFHSCFQGFVPDDNSGETSSNFTSRTWNKINISLYLRDVIFEPPSKSYISKFKSQQRQE